MKSAISPPQIDLDQITDAPILSAAARLSRRNFIKGIIATGATVAAGSMLGTLAGCSGDYSPETSVVGTVERLISLQINGKVRRVDVLPQETLAMTLRYKLGLTGTKLGCDRGECGACTVLIDDVPTYSCSTLSHGVRGRQVTTIEGLQAADGELHPVQQAFIDELGPQCGFCTPGQIMSAAALLEQDGEITDERIMAAMRGNICRCGAYNAIRRAIHRAAELMRA